MLFTEGEANSGLWVPSLFIFINIYRERRNKKEGMNMATGFYDGKVIQTDVHLKKGQKVFIPVSNRVNSKKKHAFDSLKGSLKSTSSLKEIKEERLRRYEVTN